MMKITGLSHLFKWENLHNWWLTKYFFAPLYMPLQMKLLRFLCIAKMHFVDTDLICLVTAQMSYYSN